MQRLLTRLLSGGCVWTISVGDLLVRFFWTRLYSVMRPNCLKTKECHGEHFTFAVNGAGESVAC